MKIRKPFYLVGIVLLCAGVVLRCIWTIPYVRIHYYLWKVQTDTQRISLEDYDPERLLTHQQVGVSYPFKKTASMESLVDLGPKVFPYIFGEIEEYKLMPEGMLIINTIYFKENKLTLAPVFSKENEVEYYKNRSPALLPHIWPLIESGSAKLRLIAITWLYYIGESGDEKHASYLEELAKNDDQDPKIREAAIRTLDAWDTKDHVSIAKQIINQPDVDDSLRATCLSILDNDVDQHVELLVNKGLEAKSPKVQCRSAERLLSMGIERKRALKCLIDLLTCDDKTIRAVSFQKLMRETGEAIGTRYMLNREKDLESAERYFKRVEQLRDENKEAWKALEKRLVGIWSGDEGKQRRKTIAEEWKSWFKEKYGSSD